MFNRVGCLRRCLPLLLTVSCVSVATTSPSRQSSPAFTAIVGATLIDGSGSDGVPDSVVLIAENEIKAAGPGAHTPVPAGATVIDGRGLTVVPGFVDIHNHSGGGFENDRTALTQISQGITTVVLGQDGGSELPIGQYLSDLESKPVAVNVLTFVGHATLREAVMGDDTNREATAREVSRMVELVEQSMREGAFGLSTGLEYETGKPASTEEVIQLARAAAAHRGIYMSHIRDEANRTFEALDEAVRIGEQAKIPVQISHIKMGSVSVWGRAEQAVRLIQEARARGLDITADCYPYDAWHATIRVLVPSGRHDNPEDVADALREIGGPGLITVVACEAHRDYEFRTLEDIAREQQISAVELYMQIVRDGGARVVGRSMKEEDIRIFYRQPWVMVASDGGIGVRHPRGAGTFPRVLGRYVREERWLSLPQAIRMMTSMPADRLGLRDRGLLRPGFKADLVLFDPQTVIDRATFKEPHLLSEGVKQVWVNGRLAWRDGAVTGTLAGVAVRHSAYQP